MENQQNIDKIIRKKVTRPINSGIKYNLELVKSNKDINKESINIFIQTHKLLDSSETLVKRGSIVESCILLRSAFEYLMLGFNIHFNRDAYNEFLSLSLSDDERDLTKPTRLTTEFRKHLNDFSRDVFEDINRKEKKKMLDELYDKLCSFTHGSLISSSFSIIEKSTVKNVYVLLSKINIYTVKYIFLTGLQFLSNDRFHCIKYNSLYWSYLFTLFKLSEMLNKCKDDLNFIKEYLRFDDNEKYLNQRIKEVNDFKEVLKDVQEYSINNKDDLYNDLSDFLS
jgi:hypothetical protein